MPTEAAALSETVTIMENLKRFYVDKTTTLDRATKHLEPLQAATEKGKTPNKMKINVKPLVIQKDDAQFQSEWNEVITTSEKAMVQCLMAHLIRIATTTRNNIREESNKAYLKLKQLDPTNAKSTLEEAIKSGQDIRKTKQADALKRKRERMETEKDKATKRRRTETE